MDDGIPGPLSSREFNLGMTLFKLFISDKNAVTRCSDNFKVS
jgi:hypothetical protein